MPSAIAERWPMPWPAAGSG